MPSLPPSTFPVLGAGLATSILALVVVYALGSAENSVAVMAWCPDGVLPLGALAIGLIAATGYILGLWSARVRISRPILGVICALQLATYFAGHALTYAQSGTGEGTRAGFATYFDRATRALGPSRAAAPRTALGGWGYGVRLLELTAFCACAMLVPLRRSNTPHCGRCQAYLRTKVVALVPACASSSHHDERSGPRSPEHETKKGSAFEAARDEALNLLKLAEEHRTGEFFARALRRRDAERATAQLSLHIEVRVVSCPCCYEGRLHATLVAGHGRKTRRSELEVAPLSRVFVQQVSGFN
jgi:hypothetical protein